MNKVILLLGHPHFYCVFRIFVLFYNSHFLPRFILPPVYILAYVIQSLTWLGQSILSGVSLSIFICYMPQKYFIPFSSLSNQRGSCLFLYWTIVFIFSIVTHSYLPTFSIAPELPTFLPPHHTHTHPKSPISEAFRDTSSLFCLCEIDLT